MQTTIYVKFLEVLEEIKNVYFIRQINKSRKKKEAVVKVLKSKYTRFVICICELSLSKI